MSGHWTDEQLIEYLYGVGPIDGHIDRCRDCQARLSGMPIRRRLVEESAPADDAVTFDFLAAQRRSIYARLSGAAHLRRRWASAAALLVLGVSVLVYEQKRQPVIPEDQISDADLAQTVSLMAQDSEPQPAAPLQALFDQ